MGIHFQGTLIACPIQLLKMFHRAWNLRRDTNIRPEKPKECAAHVQFSSIPPSLSLFYTLQGRKWIGIFVKSIFRWNPQIFRVLHTYVHSGQKSLRWVGGRVGGLPLSPTFQCLIIMIWRACDLNLVMIPCLASKCQDFKRRGLQFHFIKRLKNGHSNFKDLPNLNSYHKN